MKVEKIWLEVQTLLFKLITTNINTIWYIFKILFCNIIMIII